MDYCTYLTVYTGNLLPPFYIGHTTVKNVERGYHGSVSSQKYKAIWKQELTEHPHLFKTHILTRHLSRKEATIQEAHFHKMLNVRAHPLHINMANGSDEFFQEGPLQQHVRDNLRKIKTGRQLSESAKQKLRALTRSDETKRKIAIANSKRVITEETRARLSASARNQSDASRQKRSEAAKRRWALARSISNSMTPAALNDTISSRSPKTQ